MESDRTHGHKREQEGIPKQGVHHYLGSDAHVVWSADVIHVSDLTINSVACFMLMAKSTQTIFIIQCYQTSWFRKFSNFGFSNWKTEIIESFSAICVPSLFSDTEDASETDLAKHDEDDYVEIKEQ